MNAPAHNALSVQQFLTKKGMTPYTPDLTPTDFSWFPQMTSVLKVKHFADVEELKQKTAEALKGIKINKFKNCFEQWKKHLDRYYIK